MIIITGDTHSKVQRFSNKSFPIGKELTKNDYIIILGDFGLVWNYENENSYETQWLDWLNEKPWTTLFISGNHENFDRLYNYPVEEWNGGKVNKIRDSVIHLMRGQIYNIDGKTFFTMGGASSHDICDGILEVDDPRIKLWENNLYKQFRINHKSWWKEELPVQEELEEALNNLEKVDYKVDYVLTHEAPASDVFFLGGRLYEPDWFSKWLEQLRQKLDYKFWWFGHYHINRMINDKEEVLYENFRVIY